MASIGLRILTGCAAALIAAGLSSCANSADHSAHGTSSTTVEESNPHNASDVAFAEKMIPHHRQAMEMAALVPDRSQNPAVVSLANSISGQQEPEVTALSAILVQWNATSPADDGSADGGATGGGPTGGPAHSEHGSMNMGGMVDDATMARLETLTGPAFDTLWLQSMISHHEGAIAMAKTEIADGKNADMIAMAKNIVAMQQLEINQMKQILEGK